MNTPLSARGQEQAFRQRERLEAQDFLAQKQVQLIVHSHLDRARMTCYTLFDGQTQVPLEEHDELYERSISEHMVRRWLAPRLARFTAYLQNRSESRIAVVGHSSFFEALS